MIFPCDACGRATQDTDETLCRSCKPVLALRAELRECEAACDAAYWRFTRCARANPPSVAEPARWRRMWELRAILKNPRSPDDRARLDTA